MNNKEHSITDNKSDNDLAEDRTEKAENRTRFAEDRTLLANERTFSSWMGTGLTAVGVGAGFHVLFSEIEPWWLPRSVSTILILVGIFMFLASERRAKQMRERLNRHKSEPSDRSSMRIIAWSLSLAATILLVTLWFFY